LNTKVGQCSKEGKMPGVIRVTGNSQITDGAEKTEDLIREAIQTTGRESNGKRSSNLYTYEEIKMSWGPSDPYKMAYQLKRWRNVI